MSEYIGSRISLISKSDIKYIGTLHEINSDSHTVALESVTSYGTEGRKGNPAEEIPGSDQVYEYIVFRGSDVKELNIVAAPGEREKEQPKVPDDPAILGSARPPQRQQNQPPPQQQQPPNQNQFRGPPPYPQHNPQFGYPPPPPNQFQGQPRFQGPGGPHGFPGSPGAVPGYGFAPPPPPPGYGMGYGGPPPPGHGFPHQHPPGQGPPHQQFQGPPGQQPPNQQRPPPQQMQGQQQPPIGSKNKTPQAQQGRGPAPQSSQQQNVKPVEMSATPHPTSESPHGPPPPNDSKPSVAAATAPSAASQQAQQQPPMQRAANSRIAVPLAPKPKAAPAGQPPAPMQGQPQSFQDATREATAAVQAAMAKLGTASTQQTDGATDNLTQKVNQMRIQDHQQRGRGSRGRGGAPRGGPRTRAIEVPKEDYDFESANAKFNKQEMVKEAIATGSPLGSPTANGDGADPISALNGHVNGGGEKEGDEHVVIPPADKGYDKKSSFFDNISSDLKDRVEQAQAQESGGQGFDGRAMRNQERSKNMETFGQSNVDGGAYRGGYRGRGRGSGFSPNYRGRGRSDFQPRGGSHRGRGRRGVPGGGESAMPVSS